MDETSRNGRLDLNLEPDLVPDRRAATEGGWRRRSGEQRAAGEDGERRSVRRAPIWNQQLLDLFEGRLRTRTWGTGCRRWRSAVEVGEEEGGDGGRRRGREPTCEGENRWRGRRFVKETFVNW
ncbi:hypothetical protein U1Q18_013522 [Sarracenia purpurea var. burkii]